jgi:hypothetical protein
MYIIFRYILIFLFQIFLVYSIKRKYENNIPPDIQTHYKINIEKSIDKFNIALDKLDMKVLF